MAEQLPKKNYFKEIGSPGLKRNGGHINEEFVKQLSGRRAMQQYTEMRFNDPVICAGIWHIQMLARSVEWFFVPSRESRVAKKAALLANTSMYDMDHTWQTFLAEASTMLPYGFAPMEVTYKLRKGGNSTPHLASKYDDGMVGWQEISLRAQDSLVKWRFDEATKKAIAFVQQDPTESMLRIVPLAKMINFRTAPERNNPEGHSMLRGAYRPFYYKRRIEEIEGIAMERDLAGLPVLTPPEGLDLWNENDPEMVSAKAASDKLVRSIKRDEQEGVLLPFGWKLELLVSGGKRQFDLNVTIERLSRMQLMAMAMDFLMIGHSNQGSFAMAATKADISTILITTICDVIAEEFTRTETPRLMMMNGWDPEDAPILKHGRIEKIDLGPIGAFVNALHNSGFDISQSGQILNHLLGLAHLPTIEGYKPAQQKEAVNTSSATGDDDDGDD